ncbi:MAG: hypothetical protein WBQ18_15885 [Solirubrobacteraceae bacterium]
MILTSAEQRRLRGLTALLLVLVAGVHFQQYVQFMSQVPTVGVLFLLNAAGGAGLAVAVLSADPRVRTLATVGALGLSAGSLVSIVIALQSSFFGYAEPTLRFPIVLAIVVEVILLGAGAVLLSRSRSPVAGAGQ